MVASDADLADAYERTRDEAQRAFGSGVVFLERLVTGARHVEVQVIADGQGTAWALGVRDCSVQRRNQKVIEESASPVLDADAGGRAEGRRAERLAVAVGYAGAGTVEFLLPPRASGSSRSSRSTPACRSSTPSPRSPPTSTWSRRRSTSPPAAASRASARRERARRRGPAQRRGPRPRLRARRRAASACSTCPRARDPRRHRRRRGRHDPRRLRLDDRQDHRLRPRPATRRSPGCAGPWPRPPSSSRAARPTRASSSTCSTSPRWSDGSGRHRLDRPRPRPRAAWSRTGTPASRSWPPAIEAYEERGAGRAAPACSRPPTAAGRRSSTRSAGPIDLKLRGTAYKVTRGPTGPHRFRVGVAAGGDEQARRRRARAPRRATPAGSTVGGRAHRAGHRHPRPGRTSSRSTGSPTGSAATRAACCARPPRRWWWPPRSRSGDEVAAGAPVLVLESMKMETVLPAPFAARVRELLVVTGSQVETGAPLVRLEPVGDGDAGGRGGRRRRAVEPRPAGRSAAEPRPPSAPPAGRADLAAMLLGYDVDPRDERQRRCRTTWRPATSSRAEAGRRSPTRSRCWRSSPTSPSSAATARRTRSGTPSTGCTARASTSTPTCRASTSTAGRCRRSSAAGSPGCSRHYGVTDLDRTPELEEAVFRVFLAQQRCAPDVAARDRRCCSAGSPSRRPARRLDARRPARCSTGSSSPPSCGSRWSATWPAASGSAGSTSRCVDAGARQRPGRRPRRAAALAADPDGARPGRADRRARRHPRADRPVPRRAARERRVPDARADARGARSGATTASTTSTACARPPGRAAGRSPSPTTPSTGGRPGWSPRSARSPSSPTGRPAGRGASPTGRGRAPPATRRWSTCTCSWPDAPERRRRRRRERLARRCVGRCRFAQRRAPAGRRGLPGAGRPVDYFTFRPDGAGGVVEDTLVRGVHPMVGRRLTCGGCATST